MRRHRAMLRAACVAVGLAFATSPLAAEGWTTYHNAQYGFSIEVPKPPTVTVIAAGPKTYAPGVNGQVIVSEVGILVFAVADFSKDGGATADPDEVMLGVLLHFTGASGQTEDDETWSRAGGLRGLDATAHGDGVASHVRLIFRGGRVYYAIGLGKTPATLPAEYPRFARSLKPD